MIQKSSTLFFVSFLCLMLNSGCVKRNAGITLPTPDRELISQGSTINFLMTGNYDGLEVISSIKTKGDTGLGTFAGLDGEMIMLDGEIYQVKSTGQVEIPADTLELPFYAVTFFDRDLNLDISDVENLESLTKELDKLILSENSFYAIKIEGVFKYLKARSVSKQEKPYPLFSDVTKNQAIFEYSDIKGTIVGFWSPDCIGGVNVPGYHLHFISDDKTKGGHVLELTIVKGTVSVDEISKIKIDLGDKSKKHSGN